MTTAVFSLVILSKDSLNPAKELKRLQIDTVQEAPQAPMQDAIGKYHAQRNIDPDKWYDAM